MYLPQDKEYTSHHSNISNAMSSYVITGFDGKKIEMTRPLQIVEAL